MEIDTCEQYVLDQLMQAQAERDWLRDALADREAQIGELKAKLKPAPIDEAIVKAGRQAVYDDGTWFRTDVDDEGKLVVFEDWCIEHTQDRNRCGLSKREFIDYFEPEFRAEYDELAKEWKDDQE